MVALESDNIRHKESFKNVFGKVDTITHEQDKLETSVENKLEKLEGKIDKLLDFMINKVNN